MALASWFFDFCVQISFLYFRYSRIGFLLLVRKFQWYYYSHYSRWRRFYVSFLAKVVVTLLKQNNWRGIEGFGGGVLCYLACMRGFGNGVERGRDVCLEFCEGGWGGVGGYAGRIVVGT